MSLQREAHDSREDWLNHRSNGLGASEAAAVCGMSNWMTPTELWKLKTGKAKPKDLSGNKYVSFGQHAEEHLRALFMFQHPELSLDYHAYDFLFQDDKPWLRCTLDGELAETETGAKGILEIKTSSCGSKAEWAEWKDRIPDHYFTQICHQFLATGYEFAYLYAMLIGLSGDAELRTYFFLRSECQADMDYLLDKEIKFWKCVEQDKMPPAILRL